LAVVAWVRHQHTEYDSLLMKGVEREEARRLIVDEVQRTLAVCERGVSEESVH